MNGQKTTRTVLKLPRISLVKRPKFNPALRYGFPKQQSWRYARSRATGTTRDITTNSEKIKQRGGGGGGGLGIRGRKGGGRERNEQRGEEIEVEGGIRKELGEQMNSTLQRGGGASQASYLSLITAYRGPADARRGG